MALTPRVTIGRQYGWERTSDKGHDGVSSNMPGADAQAFRDLFNLRTMLLTNYPVVFPNHLNLHTSNDLVFAYRQLTGRV